MKNKKTSLIIVLSFIVMAFFFSLPVIVIKSSDAIAEGKIYTSDIKTIEFGKKLSTESLIYLIINGIRMETPESDMNLESADLMSIVKDGLSPYCDNGLIVDDLGAYTMRDYWCYRAYSDSDTSVSGAYWVVDLQTESFPRNYLFLTIDDQTGNVIFMSYLSEEPTYALSDLESYHKRMFDTYTKTVGIAFDEYVDDGTIYNRNSRQYFKETPYGDICLNFYLTDYGFNINPGTGNYE